MEVRCDQCQARYRVDDARVGPKGLAMRCGKCGNTFRLARDGTVTKAAVSKASSIPTPGSATPLASKPSPPAPEIRSEPAPSNPVAVETPSATPVPAAQPPRDEPLVGAAPAPREPEPEPLAERPAATPAAPRRVQRPPRSMQLEGAPSVGPP